MTVMEPLEVCTDGSVHSNRPSVLARIWASMAAGLAGSAAHSCLMILKSRAGLLLRSSPMTTCNGCSGIWSAAPLVRPCRGSCPSQTAPWFSDFCSDLPGACRPERRRERTALRFDRMDWQRNCLLELYG